jgi:hypothetical protein
MGPMRFSTELQVSGLENLISGMAPAWTNAD